MRYATFARAAALSALAVAAVLSPAAAQRGGEPSGPPTLIRAGRVFDSERGTFLSARDIIVRGSRIETVGENLPVPEGATVVDLRDRTVLPGLIDAHTHLLLLVRADGDESLEMVRAVTMEGTPLRALHGAARARTWLEAGFTTVRDLGNSGRFGDAALARAIDDGSAVGPRMFYSGPGISPPGGQLPGVGPEFENVIAGEYRIVRGVDDARAAVREAVVQGARAIKVYSDNTPNRASLSLDELRAVVDESRRMGVPVAAHATSDAAIWRATEAGVNSIEHGYDAADSTFRFMARRGVALVATEMEAGQLDHMIEHVVKPDPAPPAEWRLQYVERGRQRLRRARAAGVTIVAGSDLYADVKDVQGKWAARMIWGYLQSGMTPAQALQTATWNAGRLLGDDALGVIRPGAYADLIAVEGDPATDFDAMGRVRWVMKDGNVYVGEGASVRD